MSPWQFLADLTNPDLAFLPKALIIAVLSAIMCGVVGLFAKTPEVEERLGAHLGAMLGQMASRGPDSAW